MRLLSILTIWAIVSLQCCSTWGVEFTGFGTETRAIDLSGDGSITIGFNFSRGSFRWTEVGGVEQLPIIRPSAISRDGRVIVGGGTDNAYRWTEAGGIESLVETQVGSPRGVSADGSVVVGTPKPMNRTLTIGILDDRPPGSAVPNISDLIEDPSDIIDENPFLYAVSDDGSIVAGTLLASHDSRNLAVRYHPDGVGNIVFNSFEGSSRHPGTSVDAYSFAMSADGKSIAGALDAVDGDGYFGAFRWTEDEGLEILEEPIDHAAAFFAMTADGELLGGYSIRQQDANHSTWEAALWDETNGWRNVVDILEAGGIDMTGWNLREVTAISDDGTIVIGNGFNPAGEVEGWRAVIAVPEPATVVLLLAGLAQLGACRSRRG